MTGYWLRALAACWLGLLWVQPAAAHSSSTAYLDLAAADDGAVRVQWRIALRDLDALLDLDADGDGRLRWGEVLDRAAAVVTLAHERLHLRSDAAACRIDYAPLRHVRLGELGFVQLDGQAQCRGRVALRYALFDGVDPTHRVLLQVDGGAPQLLAPGGTHTVGGDTPRATLWGFVRDGVGHILGGVDHLLFLVALLLPAVVTRTAQGVVPRHDLRAALIEVAWIATAFTLAHSLTLACATFGWLRMPAAVIEPLVALTVLAAALNNLWPVVTRRLAAVAFLFGLSTASRSPKSWRRSNCRAPNWHMHCSASISASRRASCWSSRRASRCWRGRRAGAATRAGCCARVRRAWPCSRCSGWSSASSRAVGSPPEAMRRAPIRKR